MSVLEKNANTYGITSLCEACRYIPEESEEGYDEYLKHYETEEHKKKNTEYTLKIYRYRLLGFMLEYENKCVELECLRSKIKNYKNRIDEMDEDD